MKIAISFLVCIISLSGMAQRLTYDDPDLTFSIKKPKKWEVFDDGYVVEVSPSVNDSSHTYLTITYFQKPLPPTGSEDLELMTMLPQVGMEEVSITEKVKIGPYHTERSSISNDSLLQYLYHFEDHGQLWEIITSAPKTDIKAQKRFLRLIRSIKIED
ncbi:MAG: hypothetical protein Tsb0034_11460 [Ekhidna sp.]